MSKANLSFAVVIQGEQSHKPSPISHFDDCSIQLRGLARVWRDSYASKRSDDGSVHQLAGPAVWSLAERELDFASLKEAVYPILIGLARKE